MIKRVFIFFFFVTGFFLKAQTEPGIEPSNRFSVSLGPMYSEPEMLETSPNVTKRFSHDVLFALGWLHRMENKFGYWLRMELCSQTYRYQYREPSGWTVLKAGASGGPRLTLNALLTYDFFKIKRFKTFVSLGPQLHYNFPGSYSGYDDPLNYLYSEETSYDQHRVGLGYHAGTCLSYRAAKRLEVFASFNYQKGLYVFREVHIGNFGSPAVLGYSGTGWAFQAGIIFIPRNN